MNNKEKITIESYDKTVEDYIKKVDGLHPSSEFEKFINYLESDSLVLDLGCGPGRDALLLTQKGFKVIGVDLSSKMIKAAQGRVPDATFKVMDVRKLDFEDEHFNGIWASALFLHIPKADIPKALTEASRVLKAGGYLYISVKLGAGEEFNPDDRYDGVMKFWSFFQEKEIIDFLKKAGLEVLHVRTVKQEGDYASHPFIHIYCKK